MAYEILPTPLGVAQPDPRIAVTRPDQSGPNAVEALGALGGEVISGVQKGRAIRGVNEDVERFAIVSEANERGMQVDPDTGMMVGETQDAALQEKLLETRAKSTQKFREIALANEQTGVYGGSLMARLHTERTIRDLSMQTPGFEEDIRRTAASVLGYDPMGFGMRQILDVDKPTAGPQGPLTELDKWKQKVELATYQYNQANPGNPTNFATMDKFLSTTEQNLRSAESYKSRLEQGQASFEEVLNSVELKDSPLIGLYQKSQAKLAAGEGWKWDDTAMLTNEMANLKAQYKEQLIGEARRTNPNGLLGQQAMERLDTTVNRVFAPYESIVQNSTATKFLESKQAELGLKSQDFMRTVAPGLTLISEGVKNPAVATQLMEIFYSTASDPQAALWIQQNPELRAIFGTTQEPMAWLRRSAERLFGIKGVGTPALAPEDEEKQKVVDAQLFKETWKKATPESRTELAAQVAKQNPQLVLGTVSSDPRSYSTLDDKGRLVVGTTQGVELQAIISDMATLQQDGYTSVQVNSSTGELTAYRRIPGGKADGSDKWDIMPVQPAAVTRYNQTHNRMYSDPNWRSFLTNNSITSPGEAAGLVSLSISTEMKKRELEEIRIQRAQAVDRYGRDLGNEKLKAEVARLDEQFNLVSKSLADYGSTIKRLTIQDRANAGRDAR